MKSTMIPLWKYDPEDLTTWKYKTCQLIYNDNNEIDKIKWVKNPSFAFEHLETNNFQNTAKNILKQYKSTLNNLAFR